MTLITLRSERVNSMIIQLLPWRKFAHYLWEHFSRQFSLIRITSSEFLNPPLIVFGIYLVHNFKGDDCSVSIQDILYFFLANLQSLSVSQK